MNEAPTEKTIVLRGINRHQTIVAGSHVSCDVRLNDAPFIAGRHFEISRGHGATELYDARSELANAWSGNQIQVIRDGHEPRRLGHGVRWMLEPGDQIIVGFHRFFWIEGPT